MTEPQVKDQIKVVAEIALDYLRPGKNLRMYLVDYFNWKKIITSRKTKDMVM